MYRESQLLRSPSGQNLESIGTLREKRGRNHAEGGLEHR